MRASFNSLKGKFLIATPSLLDYNFKEGVVFLCEHDENGAFGFLINRPLSIDYKIQLNSALHLLIDKIQDFCFYVGGPVNINSVMLLVNTKEDNNEKNRIIKGVTLISDILNPESLNIISKESVQNVRLYLGCAGWDKMQLEKEISSGFWIVLDPDIDMIFAENPEKVWRMNLARAGGIFEIFSKMPDKKNLLDN